MNLQQQQQERQGVQQLLGHVAASQAGNERLAAEDARYAPRTGTGSGQVFAGPDSALAGGTGVLPLGAGGNLSAGPANATFQQGGSFTDATGNSYRVTPQQRQQLTNLQASGVTDPDQLAAATKKILGVPDLQGVQNADGTTSYVNPEQAVNAGLGNQRVGISQQRAENAKSAADVMQQDRDKTFQQREQQFQQREQQLVSAGANKSAVAALHAQRRVADEGEQSAQTNFDNLLKTAPKDLNLYPTPDQTEGEPQQTTTLRAKILKALGDVNAAKSQRDQAYQTTQQQFGLGTPAAPAAGNTTAPGAQNNAAQNMDPANPSTWPGAVVAPDGTIHLPDGRVLTPKR